MAAKKITPFGKFEVKDKAMDKKKGVKETPKEEKMDRKMMGKPKAKC